LINLYVRVAGVIAAVAAVSLTFNRDSLRAAPAPSTIRVGAVFPLQGPMSSLARHEYRGVQIARDLVNASGGVRGRKIELVTRNLHDPTQASSVMQGLRASGVNAVLGAYSSALSIPASTAAASRGMVYWEAGAVADRLTGRGLPRVFRVGASGSNLGSNSARFAALQLAARLGKRPAALRISLVYNNDAYATSVADAAVRQARQEGLHVVSRTQYSAYTPDWPATVRAVAAAHPDILILASHIPDGVAFRRAMLAAHLRVGAFIGSTMAQCVPEFGALLGRDAVGVFASDRPGQGFDPRTLPAPAHALYTQLAAAWRAQTGERQPDEEALAGFTAGWALFHDVLPRAAQAGSLTPSGITYAARSMNLPRGSLPNGAGLKFATDAQHLGQNQRAAAVIWQWQGVRHSVVVWPSVYATGHITMVPLPR